MAHSEFSEVPRPESFGGRWQQREAELDRELPDRVGGLLAEGDLRAYSAGGELSAWASREQVHTSSEAPAAIWGAAHRDTISIHWDGDEKALNSLLDGWIADARANMHTRLDRGHLEDARWDTSLAVTAPSRDSELVRPLVSRGFVLAGVSAIRVDRDGAGASDGLTVITVAPGGAADAADFAGPAEQARRAEARLGEAGLSLRQAVSSDLDTLADLDHELLTHDAQHATVVLREGARAFLRHLNAERLEHDPLWTWIVEDAAGPAGYLSFEMDRPEHERQCAERGPLAYLQAMYLRPRVRGAGLGEAFVTYGHARAAEAGYRRFMLDYAALNPRSGAFWSRMGYRPLWNYWLRRPAF